MNRVEEIQKLLLVSTKLYEWESNFLDIFSTKLGRIIFFNLVKHFCNYESLPVSAFKKIYEVNDASERGVRIYLNRLKELDLIKLITVDEDKRCKQALPTAKMADLILDYGHYTDLIMRDYYHPNSLIKGKPGHAIDNFENDSNISYGESNLSDLFTEPI